MFASFPKCLPRTKESLDIAMQYLDKIVRGSRLLGINLRTAIQNVKSDFALHDFHQQAINGPPTRSNLLEHILASRVFFNCFANALQLPLNSVYPNQQLLLLARSVRHEALLDILYWA